VYVDGPIHDYPDRQNRDDEKRTALRNAGYTVVRFKHSDDWREIFTSKPSIFGSPKAPTEGATIVPGGIDKDLFPAKWHPLIDHMTASGICGLEPGADVKAEGKVVGSFLGEIVNGKDIIRFVDSDDTDKSQIIETLRAGGAIVLEANAGEEEQLVVNLLSVIGGNK
jgi:hypothetical protein